MNPLPTVGHVIQVRWDVDQAFRKRRIMETQINENARAAEKLFNALCEMGNRHVGGNFPVSVQFSSERVSWENDTQKCAK